MDEQVETGAFTVMQARVAEIFGDVLGLEVLDANVNFLALGGTSLQVMRVQNRIRKELGLEIKMRAILDRPTVRGVAVVLEQAEPVPDRRPKLTRPS
jgi:acyl carrier protein